ncbi:Protein MIZU-KUSSEI 1-like plant protein [Dioscorea alata]|uniref:Protein MIZU-KUSSEI 1-like plant protein n=1 Tax=Dioscorea alata TaxID=55571 RepID=A0ACB7VS84_DIOAL|nr:Protein MIZU-KUSSEI 1-like plant protein [Dioscorea alata]
MTKPPPPPPPSTPLPEPSSSDHPSTPGHSIPMTLLQRTPHHRRSSHRPTRLYRAFRSAFRSLPILTPATCRLHGSLHRGTSASADGHIHGATRTTGTLFGHRKARISLSFQDNPRSLPLLLLDLSIPTAKFMQELGSSGLFRVALECEKKTADKTKLLDEPAWTAFVNGRSIGYATRRDPTENDLMVMQLLQAVSMGAGVLPNEDPVEGELTYMRAHFDRVVGSRDSETFYMLNPDGNSGPELTVFFVRI